MYVNIDGLNDAEKIIKTCENYLENAASYCSISDIPEDFKYGQKLKNIGKTIMNIEEDLERIRFLLGKKVVEFENGEKRNVSLISKITD